MPSLSNILPLPDDVLGEILKEVPLKELTTISLVSKNVRGLAIPRMFRTFLFAPTLSADRQQGSRLQATHEESVAKLRFFTSGDISRHVRACYVDASACDVSHRDACAYKQLLDLFFELIPSLTNVQKLEFKEVPFNVFALAQLGKLSNIDLVRVVSCTVPIVESPWPSILARALSVNSHASLQTVASGGVLHEWASIVNRNYLEILEIAAGDASTTFFAEYPVPQQFPNVRRLTIDFPRTMGPQLPAILQHFPMLEELALPACYMTETMEPPVPGVGGGQMPALRSYYGPYPLLPQVISADTSLTELSLCDFGCHGCDLGEITHMLHSHASSLRDVHVFKVLLNHLPSGPSSLSVFCTRFPHLRVLDISSSVFISTHPFTPPGFLDTFPVDELPETLETLRLHWQADSVDEAASKSEAFASAALARRSSLQFLSLLSAKRFEYALSYKQKREMAPAVKLLEVTINIVENLWAAFEEFFEAEG